MFFRFARKSVARWKLFDLHAQLILQTRRVSLPAINTRDVRLKWFPSLHMETFQRAKCRSKRANLPTMNDEKLEN